MKSETHAEHTYMEWLKPKQQIQSQFGTIHFYVYIYICIYIYICFNIIKSYWRLRLSWLHPSVLSITPGGLLDSILFLHKADISNFLFGH